MSSKTLMIDAELKEIIPAFLKKRINELKLIEKYLDQNQFQKIQSVAHKLAGSAGSYGFHELGLIASQMEEACLNNEFHRVAPLLEEYQEFMDNLHIEYKP